MTLCAEWKDFIFIPLIKNLLVFAGIAWAMEYQILPVYTNSNYIFCVLESTRQDSEEGC